MLWPGDIDRRRWGQTKLVPHQATSRIPSCTSPREAHRGELGYVEEGRESPLPAPLCCWPVCGEKHCSGPPFRSILNIITAFPSCHKEPWELTRTSRVIFGLFISVLFRIVLLLLSCTWMPRLWAMFGRSGDADQRTSESEMLAPTSTLWQDLY